MQKHHYTAANPNYVGTTSPTNHLQHANIKLKLEKEQDQGGTICLKLK